MQTLSNFAASQFPFAILIAMFFIAMGITVVAKFDSKWGYVLMVAAALFALFTLKVNRIF
ncbi:MAG: hypothetical protein ABI579_00215 [Candidatus Sumerlaeota bacterium]